MIFASLIGFLYSIAGSTGSSKLTDSQFYLLIAGVGLLLVSSSFSKMEELMLI